MSLNSQEGTSPRIMAPARAADVSVVLALNPVHQLLTRTSQTRTPNRNLYAGFPLQFAGNVSRRVVPLYLETRTLLDPFIPRGG